MKHTLFLILLNLLFTNILISQKYDFKWLIGFIDRPKRESVVGHTLIRILVIQNIIFIKIRI